MTIANSLKEFLKNPGKYTKLNLTGDRISADEVKSLVEALKVNASITNINLCALRASCAVGIELVKVIKLNTSITEIALRNNNILDYGVIVLFDALKLNTSITEIDLSYNKISDYGAEALYDALKVNTSITKIDFSGNEIGHPGIIALAKALKVNTSIRSISLNNNGLLDIGVIVLFDALKLNTSITEIDLSGNRSISKSHLEVINSLVDRNKALLKIEEKILNQETLSEADLLNLPEETKKAWCDKVSNKLMKKFISGEYGEIGIGSFMEQIMKNCADMPLQDKTELTKSIDAYSKTIETEAMTILPIINALDPFVPLMGIKTLLEGNWANDKGDIKFYLKNDKCKALLTKEDGALKNWDDLSIVEQGDLQYFANKSLIETFHHQVFKPEDIVFVSENLSEILAGLTNSTKITEKLSDPTIAKLNELTDIAMTVIEDIEAYTQYAGAISDFGYEGGY